MEQQIRERECWTIGVPATTNFTTLASLSARQIFTTANLATLHHFLNTEAPVNSQQLPIYRRFSFHGIPVLLVISFLPLSILICNKSWWLAWLSCSHLISGRFTPSFPAKPGLRTAAKHPRSKTSQGLHLLTIAHLLELRLKYHSCPICVIYASSGCLSPAATKHQGLLGQTAITRPSGSV